SGGSSNSGGSSGSSGSSSGGSSGSGGSASSGGASSSGGSPGSGGASGSTKPTVFSRTGLAARLSKFEYKNSITDVLGVDLQAGELDATAGGIPDDTGDGVLKNLADKQISGEQQPL